MVTTLEPLTTLDRMFPTAFLTAFSDTTNWDKRGTMLTAVALLLFTWGSWNQSYILIQGRGIHWWQWFHGTYPCTSSNSRPDEDHPSSPLLQQITSFKCWYTPSMAGLTFNGIVGKFGTSTTGLILEPWSNTCPFKSYSCCREGGAFGWSPNKSPSRGRSGSLQPWLNWLSMALLLAAFVGATSGKCDRCFVIRWG